MSDSDERRTALNSRASQDGAGFSIGTPRPRQQARTGGAELVRQARAYYDRGLIPVPVAERVPCVRWEQRLGWKTKALGGELPSWEEVSRAFAWAEAHRGADGITVILPPGVLVIDPDSQEGKRWLAQRELPACPKIGGRRGSHFWYSTPVRFEGLYRPVAGVDFLGAGHLVFVVPSHKGGKWKRWVRRFGDGPLPSAPGWATQLLADHEEEKRSPKGTAERAPARSKAARPVKLLPITSEDLRILREYIPGVRLTYPTATAQCPFPNHEDRTPSFVFYRRVSDGQIHWRDFGKCAESLTGVKHSAKTGKAIEYHGGTLRELRRLLGMGGGAGQHNLAFQAAAALSGVDPDVEKFVHLLLLKAKRCMLDLREEIDFTVREIAREVGCERLVIANPDGRPRVHLSNNGRTVKAFIKLVQAQTGITLIPGRNVFHPEGKRNTAFIIPQAWITPRRTQMSGDTGPESESLTEDRCSSSVRAGSAVDPAGGN